MAQPKNVRFVLESKVDSLVAAEMRNPISTTRLELLPIVDSAAEAAATTALAGNGTVAAAAAAAADTAVDAALDDAGIVYGNTPAYDNSSPLVGGFIGENGRPTELVFDDEGKVPKEMVDEWADRMGIPETVEANYSTDAVGGFVGENNRETDLVFDENGEVLQTSIERWAPRMGPVIGQYITEIGPPEPVVLVPEIDPLIKASGGRKLWVKDRDGVIKRQTSDPNTYAAWGDSLTDGWTKPPFAADQSDAWPGVLATLLGKPVYNGGKSGQSADEIAVRQGGLVLMVTPEGGSIPASGEVTLLHDSVVGWRLDRGWNCVGTVAGVHGTLTRYMTTGRLGFTPTATGAVVPVSAPVPFISEPGTLYRNAVSYFMLGRNDIGYTVAGSSIMERIVMANIAAVESLAPQNPRFLIFGTLNSTGEGVGNSNYNAVVDSNTALSLLYPDNYFDMRDYIVHQSIYDQGITPTAADLTNMAGDKPPATIMLDSIHYTVATAATIAQKAYALTTQRGWNV